MAQSFHWLDVDRIAEELADAHPARDPLSVRFTELRELVKALPGFVERPGHPVNEKILETIQMKWREERGDADRSDDE
ncbi:MAG: Fe-S cluster assembly protein IscX [Phycisphaerales bacterium]